MTVNLAVANAVLKFNGLDIYILLAKRKDNNLLAMPGGKPKFPNETLLNTAIRETEEETNLSHLEYIAIDGVNQYEWFIIHDIKPIKELWLTTFFVSVIKGTYNIINKEPHKNYNWGWYNIRELLPMACDPYTPPMLLKTILHIFGGDGPRPIPKE